MPETLPAACPSSIAGQAATARRALLLSLLATSAVAQEPVAEAAGRRLVLNGTGVRRFFGFQVFRAWLYLEARSSEGAAIIASPGVKLIRSRYLRDVPRDRAEGEWESGFSRHCGCPMPPAFRARLRDLQEGETETWLYTPAGADVFYNNEPPVRLPPAQATRMLGGLIGPNADSEGLRRGLLGLG
ncbi:chalcone isomerase family protein [Muricoccus radiodurans]|uniref:chalcone isomerase family protein n=1 Tax=Muricoccus radiodurans TaxID=2231721 RepID=UPI003CF25189